MKKFLSNVWAYLKKARVEYIVILCAIIADLVSKAIVEGTMSEGQTINLIPNFLNVFFVYNNKAAFSFDFGLGALFGAQGTVIAFIIITFISLFVFFFVLYKCSDCKIFTRISIALIIGGAVGNLYDRIFIGEVRDFIQIVYFGLDLGPLGTSFAVFNIADACLTIGIIMIILALLFLDRDFIFKAFEKKKNTIKTETEEGEVEQIVQKTETEDSIEEDVDQSNSVEDSQDGD